MFVSLFSCSYILNNFLKSKIFQSTRFQWIIWLFSNNFVFVCQIPLFYSLALPEPLGERGFILSLQKEGYLFSIDHIAFEKIAMHFGRWGLPREIISLLKKFHFCFSRGNSYCHTPCNPIMLCEKPKCDIINWQKNWYKTYFTYDLPGL